MPFARPLRSPGSHSQAPSPSPIPASPLPNSSSSNNIAHNVGSIEHGLGAAEASSVPSQGSLSVPSLGSQYAPTQSTQAATWLAPPSSLPATLLHRHVSPSGSPSSTYTTLVSTNPSNHSASSSGSSIAATYTSSSSSSSPSHITPSSSTTLPSALPYYSGSSLGLSLATGYDADSDKEQLEAMAKEAAASASHSQSSSTVHSPKAKSSAVLPSGVLEQLLLTPATSPGTSRRTIASGRTSPQPANAAPASLPSNLPSTTPTSSVSSVTKKSPSASPTAEATPLPKKALSRKQRLFALSSSEGEEEERAKPRGPSAQIAARTSSSPPKSIGRTFQQLGHIRADSDPTLLSKEARTLFAPDEQPSPGLHGTMRRSISAISGVTVIGKGGSTTPQISRSQSTRSSRSPRAARLSLDDTNDEELQRFHQEGEGSEAGENVISPTEAFPEIVLQPKPGSAMDMSAALHLLQTYPGTTSPTLPSGDFESLSLARSSRPGLSLGHPASIARSPQVPRSVSSSTRSQPVAGPSEVSSAANVDVASQTREPRRKHSRSSMGDRDWQFSMSPLSPLSQGEGPSKALSPSFRPQVSPLPRTTDFDGYAWQSERWEEPSSSRGAQQRETSTSPKGSPITGSTGNSSPRPAYSRRSSRHSDMSRSNSQIQPSDSTGDLTQIMRSFSAKPRRSRHSTSRDADNHTSAIPASTSAASLSSSATNADESFQSARLPRSRTPSHVDLKAILRQKRRQASAPFHAAVAIPAYSSDPHDTSEVTSPTMVKASDPPTESVSPHSSVAPTKPWEAPLARRARSRHNTAAGVSSAAFPLRPLSMAQLNTGPGTYFETARIQALRGMSEVVMTPSVEEWRQLGLDSELADNASGSETDTSSVRSAGEDEQHNDAEIEWRPKSIRTSSISSVNKFYGAIPPSQSVQHANNSKDSFTHPRANRMRISELQSDESSDAGDDESDNAQPHISQRSARGSVVIPTLSRGSVTSGGARHSISSSASALSSITSPESVHQRRQSKQISSDIDGGGHTPSTASLPKKGVVSQMPAIPLDSFGPVDAHAYSAITGARNIHSFTVEREAGKGAYGLVRKVREIDESGHAIGADLMLKYIVKQRILADAYKRHKVLGAIPMEIHVLDHIRKVYRPPTLKSPLDELNSSIGKAASFIVGHPNLCGMLDFFEDAENYYLVMPCFGTGQDLFDYVDAAPTGLSLAESRNILRQIVDAVAFLHAHGIVHRDIKDENIILDGHGGVQLIDFGSAAYVKEGKPYFDTFSGTLDFASPEVLRGERYGGKETDIWALGVLAYVILCGECPFWSSEESLAGLSPESRANQALLAKADDVDQVFPTYLERHTNNTYRPTAGDAVDLTYQCLQVHSRNRPSALQLKQHRFLIGESGWLGLRGWEDATTEGSQSEADP